jgi:tetratricopeptide (TPR) repeat protein
MSEATQRDFDLDAVRTDGWFERIGEGIGSFQALCEIVGERFFAFSIIVGARITALTVDRRNPDLSLVDFVVGLGDADEEEGAQLVVLHDGVEETHDLDAFRFRVRALVREELERIATGSRSAIDLSKVSEAEAAALRKEWAKVVQLLGSWPAPLAIFLRTPEGQLLTSDARGLIAKGLGLLGSACVHLGEIEQAEEVFRIGIQYAQEGVAAADLFRRLGEALLQNERPGEAIGPLRRALAFGGAASDVMPPLARAFLKRKRFVAAYACLREALEAGVRERDVADELRQVEAAMGVALTGWKAKLVEGEGT